MKKLLTILFLFSKAFATNYYVDNSGSDLNAGTSTGTAWQSVAKVNNSMGIFVSGDNILFNRNGTWNERLNVTVRGLNIGTYNSGNNPLLTGFTTISLTNIGGNIWQGTATLKNLNAVTYNGVLVSKARTPNTGYSTYSNHSAADTSITTTLPNSPSYIGKEVVIRVNNYEIDRKRITSQSSGLIGFQPATKDAMNNGFGYILMNSLNDMDVNGEWVFDSTLITNNFWIYSTTTPTVQVSNQDTVIFINAHNVTLNNITVTGGNRAGIFIYNADTSSVLNCYVNNSGRDGIAMSRTNDVKIQWDTVLNSLGNGMFLRYNLDSIGINNYRMNVKHNNIQNCGMLIGMSDNYYATSDGIIPVGDHSNIDSNYIKNTGYDGIVPTGDTTTVSYNVIDSFNMNKSDGGGIYTITQKHGLKIDSNIITNSGAAGAIAGTTGPFLSCGIYIDNACSNVTAIGNTCYNIHGGYGISMFINGGSNEIIKYNTLMDSDSGSLAIALNTGSGNTIISNKFIQTNTTSPAFEKSSGFLFNYASFDSDFYSRPLREDSITIIIASSGASFYRSLSNFKIAASPYEANGFGTPANTIGVPVIYYNTTNTNSTITLPSKMKDYMGTVYSGSVTLAPYTSIVLYNYNSKIYFGYYSK